MLSLSWDWPGWAGHSPRHWKSVVITRKSVAHQKGPDSAHRWARIPVGTRSVDVLRVPSSELGYSRGVRRWVGSGDDALGRICRSDSSRSIGPTRGSLRDKVVIRLDRDVAALPISKDDGRAVRVCGSRGALVLCLRRRT